MGADRCRLVMAQPRDMFPDPVEIDPVCLFLSGAVQSAEPAAATGKDLAPCFLGLGCRQRIAGGGAGVKAGCHGLTLGVDPNHLDHSESGRCLQIAPQTREPLGFFGKLAGFCGRWIVFEGVGSTRSVKKNDLARAVFKDCAGNRAGDNIGRHEAGLGEPPDRTFNGAALRDVALFVHRLPDFVAEQG